MSARKLIVYGKMYGWAIFFGAVATVVRVLRSIGTWKPTKVHEKPEAWSDPALGEHRFAQVNGIRMHYVIKGDPAKPAVLLLHGYPECWFSWRHQLLGLNISNDHCLIVPSLRGYGESDKPSKIADYDWPVLVEDIRALIEALGHRSAVVVAHDWGGIVGWVFAAHYPDWCRKLFILNSPNPASFGQLIGSSWIQHFRSYYMYLYQLPWIPEFIFRWSDYGLFDLAIRASDGRKLIRGQELEVYKYSFSNGPNSLSGPINYYRNLLGHVRLDPTGMPHRVRCPVRVVWARQDRFLSEWFAEDARKFCEGGFELEFLDGVGHFCHMEAPDRVNSLIREFIEK